MNTLPFLLFYRTSILSGTCVRQSGSYVADIGFTIRENATGGGAVLNRKMISMLNSIGMEIYFSEYNFINET